MPEAEVVYADVKFTASKENKEKCSSPETTYDEVKIMKPPSEAPSAAETNGSGGRSKVTERALLLVLCALLLAAAVGLCLVSVHNLQTRKELDEIQAKVKSFENCTVVNSSVLVRPTCLNESQLQTCMNENEALRKNLTAAQCPTCETEWDQHGGSCYYFSSNKLTWDQSRSDCKGQGADLVQINSKEEQRFLDDKVGRKMTYFDDKFWIGLTDSKEEGRWLWVDDSPLNTSLSFWYKTEPDNWTEHNADGEDCANMGVQGGATDLKWWFDRSCRSSKRYICEKAAKTG
ncbi:C-type lectin domain family 4 member E-like isoform X2 [Betta splendens]|uniref:C-type lectin domain family 4 member E-like isoform X2 n=1 Tax=Betta splendens TaxID=158456 RepID=A0A9W2Y4U2_BETSP|nr:C-type lectin domain family 4 member E-like isoform X2 [Betta splendens]